MLVVPGNISMSKSGLQYRLLNLSQIVLSISDQSPSSLKRGQNFSGGQSYPPFAADNTEFC